MNYCVRVQQAIDYMEEHLADDIDCDSVIRQCYYSKIHFRRIFNAMVGFSLSEYLRRRRVNQAAVMLCTTDQRIIDIALRYGFGSQEAFSRAFLKEYHVTPGRVRHEKLNLDLFEKVDVSQVLAQKLYKLRDYSTNVFLSASFCCVGMKCNVRPESETIKELWNKVALRRNEVKDSCQDGSYGIYKYIPEILPEDEFLYFAGIRTSQTEHIPEEFEVMWIPASKYVRVLFQPEKRNLRETFELFYGVWLPSSCFTLKEQATIEFYPNDGNMEIWFPITND